MRLFLTVEIQAQLLRFDGTAHPRSRVGTDCRPDRGQRGHRALIQSRELRVADALLGAGTHGFGKTRHLPSSANPNPGSKARLPLTYLKELVIYL